MVVPLRPVRFVRRLVLLGVLSVLAFALWVGDRSAERWAEGRLADEIAGAVPEARTVTVDIDSFPFLPRLVGGSVEALTVVLDEVSGLGIAVDSLTFIGRDLGVDVTGARLRDVATIDASALVTEGAVTDSAGVPVSFSPGRVRVVLDGQTQIAGVATDGADLIVTISGHDPIRIDLGLDRLLPCPDVAVEIATGTATLACVLTGLPPALADAIG